MDEYLRALLGGQPQEGEKIPGVIIGQASRNVALVRTAERGIIRCINTRLPNRVGLPVFIEYVNGEWQVTGIDHVALPEPGGYHYVPPHGEAHEFNNPSGGDDVIWLAKPQYTPFLVAPTDPPTRAVRVFPGLYYDPDGVLHSIPSEQLILMDDYFGPETREVLIVLDTSSGNVVVIEESTAIPGQVPLAMVRLRPGASRIHWDDILDARDIPPSLAANALLGVARLSAIVRWSAGSAAYYPLTPEGLQSALAEAVDGDVILVPSPIAAGTISVPAGVTVDLSWSTVSAVSGNGTAIHFRQL